MIVPAIATAARNTCVRATRSPRNATAKPMINTGCSEPMSVTSSSRVSPSAAKVVAAPAMKNAPAPKSSETQRARDISSGQNGALAV